MILLGQIESQYSQNLMPLLEFILKNLSITTDLILKYSYS